MPRVAAADPKVPTHQWRTLDALRRCRTGALGGHRYRCADCGREHFVPHSCRHRHCPQCQGSAARDWLAVQRNALLPAPYFHLVFTLPHELNPLVRQNRQALYRLLFAAVSQTLLEFGRNNLSAQIGVTAILHTWSQTLLDHYHLHGIVPGGGISLDGSSWVAIDPKYLFNVHALARVYRAKFRDGLHRLWEAGDLECTANSSPWPPRRVLKNGWLRSWTRTGMSTARRPSAARNRCSITSAATLIGWRHAAALAGPE